MEACGIAVKENCCNCSLCSSSCPFDAIDIVDEAAKIDIDKCQYCGLCYSVCPSNVISSEYFDMESLIDDLKAAMETSESKELVLVCRGTAEKLKIPEAIQLKLPCLGRVPIQFYFEAIILGIEKIHLYACDDDYCRYEKGSKNAWRRALLAQRLLDQFGYRPIIEFQRSSLKVSVNRNRCIGCGNCFYVCPYDAIHLDSPGIARIEIDSCLGCGRCVPVCPSFAISLEGSERDKISSAISNFSSQQISPKILVFYCKWCEFKLNPRENVQLIELPCSGRIDPLHIYEALIGGIDGILVITCQEGDCRLEEGDKSARRSIQELRDVLKEIGLEERVEITSSSPKYPGQFDERLEIFMDKFEKR